jgi:hypothetical protein
MPYYQSFVSLRFDIVAIAIQDIRNIEAKRTLLIPYNRKIKANRTLLIQELKKIKAKRTRLIPEIGKIEAKKKPNWIEVK